MQVIYIYIIWVIVIVQQYGLPEILLFFKRIDAVPRNLLYNAGTLAIAQHTVRNTSDTNESDLGWCNTPIKINPFV